MVRQRFKNKDMQKIYEWFIEHDPGAHTRGMGGCHSAFYQGRHHDFKAMHVRDSLAYAAWRAGRDLRQKEAK